VATDDGTDSKPVRFSTDDLPARDRLAIWREQIARGHGRFESEPIGEGPLRFETSTRRLDRLTVTSLSAESVRTRRTRELLADGNDDVMLMLLDEGQCHASQLGREATVGANDALFVSNSDVSSTTVLAARAVSLRIPRQAIVPLTGKIEDAFLRPMPRTSEALFLLSGYLAALERMPQPLTPDIRHLVETHVHDLVAIAVGATRDAADLAMGRGVRAARFGAIKADIAKHIAREDMSAEWIAPRHGVSASHVRRLFEEDGLTFSEFVLGYRLAQAHRRLCDPRLTDRTISSLAFALGFGDLSYFNRMFRRRYGAAPSEVRAASRQDTRA
jgi:AraC-like DNA-binding protein